MKITRPQLSRVVGFSLIFLLIFVLNMVLSGEDLLYELQGIALVPAVVMLALAAVLSWHYTIFPLKYSLWLFPLIGIAMGLIFPLLLGGYGVMLIPFTVPAFGLITTLGPKFQDMLDRLPAAILYILLTPSIILLIAATINSIRFYSYILSI